MLELNGKFNTAKVFTDNIEQEAISQVIDLCNQEAFADSKIRIMPDVHAGAGCTVGTTMTIKDKVVPNLVGVDIGCLDAETEFITENGFKKISEYKKGDKVLQYDLATDTAVFVEPYAYIDKPCEKFWHFKNSKGLDQMVSEEHRMLVFYGYKGRGYQTSVLHPEQLASKSLSNGYYAFKAAYSSANKGLNMTDNQLKLRIALCADGRIKVTDTGLKVIEFHFSRDRKIKRLQDLLDLEKLIYTKYEQKDGTTVFYLSSDKNDLSVYEKTMSDLYTASRHQLEVIAKESLLWDGHEETENSRAAFTSTNKEFADFIQFAFSGINIRAGISILSTHRENESDIYCVSPTKNEYVGYSSPTIVEKDNMRKYCFIVPSSYFVIRRNGRIAITGNCGMEVVRLNTEHIDFEKLDAIIHEYVPSGHSTRDKVHAYMDNVNLSDLHCYSHISASHAELSLGSLGGGNHFIEVDKDSSGQLWLVIHSGSRHLGLEIAKFYQNEAYKRLQNAANKETKDQIIQELTAQGRQREIEKTLKNKVYRTIRKDIAYCEGELFDQYIHDIDIAQQFASWNRKAMVKEILDHLGLPYFGGFTTIHNYIDLEHMVLRKGAVSAQEGERLIIPMNMRDGSLICTGKGNPDWNCSAPHGAGRIMSRSKAKQAFTMDEFEDAMKGIYTTSVNQSTLDESPMSYKPIDEIIANIGDTVTIDEIIKPVYNFKANG